MASPVTAKTDGLGLAESSLMAITLTVEQVQLRRNEERL